MANEQSDDKKNTANTQKWTLPKENELRLEVKGSQNVKLKLVTGTAECFGTELAKGRFYVFSDCASCIYTWEGCVIEIEGECHAYVANETPMNMYLNTHVILQQKREKARETQTQGPKVFIVGSTDAGKYSLSKLLFNYAARLGEIVTYVDLDVGKGSITLPGMLSAIPVERPYDIEEGFGLSQPIAFFYGDVTASQNPKLYSKQVANLASIIKKRNELNRTAACSGIIVNTMGWVDGQGYQLLCEAIEAFVPDIILVLAHERLYSDLQNSLSKQHPNIQLVKMPKSGGVVTRDAAARRNQSLAHHLQGPTWRSLPHFAV